MSVHTSIVAVVFMCVVQPAAASYFVEIDTGHPMGRHVLDVGVETPIRVGFSTTFEGGLPAEIGLAVVDFSSSSDQLSWDYDGADDEPFTSDDGFVWDEKFNNPNLWAIGLDPPTLASFGPAVILPIPGSVELATFYVTAESVGQFDLSVDAILDVGLFGGFVFIEDEITMLNVVPEPAMIGYMLIFLTVFGIRRRTSM